MQPLTIEIEGSYFDSYLSGRQLFLFSPEGTVRAYSWQKLAEAVCRQCEDPLVAELLFTSPGISSSALFKDDRVRTAAIERISQATSASLRVESADLSRAFLKEQEMPVEFPFSSFDIYDGTAFIGGSLGVSSIACYQSLRRVFSAKGSTNLFEAPCTWVTPGWSVVVASAGEDGLWEIYPYSGDLTPKRLSKASSTYHAWIGASLYASSPNQNESILIEYSYRERSNPVRTRTEAEILGDVETSWGGANRICGLTKTGIRVVEVQLAGSATEVESGESGLVLLDPFDIDVAIDGRFVSAANSTFGTLVETENQFVLIDSEYRVLASDVAPVSWRVYPRSKTYHSFLSVAFEDKLLQMIFPDALLPLDTSTGARASSARRGTTRSAVA